MRGCKRKGVDKESCTINEFVIFQLEVLYNSQKIYSNILYCGLFHDAVSASDIASTDMWRTGEKLGEKKLPCSVSYYPGICMEYLKRKT